MTTFSYTRVSTLKDQTVANQILQIETAGFKIDKSFEDTGVSGSISAFDRPAFKSMLSEMKESDTCVCISVDRLGRSALDVLKVVEYFRAKNIKLRILQLDMIDLTSSMGKLVLTMLAAVAEMERNLIKERTVSGLERTKAQGTVLGKPLKHTPDHLKTMQEQLSQGVKMVDVAHRNNISERQLARYKSMLNCPVKMQEYTNKFVSQQKQLKGSV